MSCVRFFHPLINHVLSNKMVNRGMSETVLQASSTDWCQMQASFAVPLQQSYEYGKVCQALGREVSRLKILDEGQTVYAQFIIGSILGRRRLALCSRGPILIDGKDDPVIFMGASRKALSLARLSAMIVTPDFAGGSLGIPMMTGATVAEVGLDKCERQQRAKMHGKWRNRLVRAEGLRGEVEIAPVSEGLIAQFSELDRRQQKIRGYRSLPPQFLKLWAQCNPEKTHILVRWDRGEIVAAMIFLRHGVSATYFLGWRKDSSSGSEHNLLLWRAMRMLVELGVQRLDLGQIDTINTPGIARFKIGVGAQARQLGKTYWIN